MAAPPVGARNQQPLILDPAAIRAGATAVGDQNPLHHDQTVADLSRFNGLIASGAHTSAILCGLASRPFGTELADGRGSVGLEYNARFRAPVRPGRELLLEWVVTATEPRRAGTLARLEGRILDVADDTDLVTATLTVLYFA